jgi:hypothetical protein
MRISFELNEDQELRAAIRELVRGETKGMMRQTIQEVINEELAKRVDAQFDRYNLKPQHILDLVQKTYRDEINRRVSASIDEHVPALKSKDRVKKIVNDTLAKLLDNWVSAFMSANKVNAAIKKQMAERITEEEKE